MRSTRHATVRDAACLLGVCPETVRAWERRGVLPRAMRGPTNGWRRWDMKALRAACERLQPQVAAEATEADDVAAR